MRFAQIKTLLIVVGINLFESIIPIACAQQPPQRQPDPVDFLPPNIVSHIMNSNKVMAFWFEQDPRGHTSHQTDNPLFGFKPKASVELSDDYAIKSVKNILLQKASYDTTGYLPRCGFDPDYGLVFYQNEKTIQVMMMLGKDCNLIRFRDGEQDIITKELQSQGRDQLRAIFKGLFPESFMSDTPSTPVNNSADSINEPFNTSSAPTNQQTGQLENRGHKKDKKHDKKDKEKVIEEYHVIKDSKDTFFSLAKRYKTTVEAIKELNPNVDPQKLKKGDKIRVH